jgi:Arc/MetJ-type ribon-helix-helix transcriptional regulator
MSREGSCCHLFLRPLVDIKTRRLYAFFMRLLNVRLGDDDVRRVRILRERGISVSDLVREAIRAEAEQTQRGPRDVTAILAEMDRLYPTEHPRRGNRPSDGTDRKLRQRIIRRKLRRQT